MDKIKSLLERGYFPSQLPPGFLSTQFAVKAKSIAKIWSEKKENGKPVTIAPSCRGESFSVARAGHSRRGIVIPNPVAQYYLSKEIVTHWRQIQNHLRKSKLSLSKPIFDANSNRALPLLSMHELYEKKIVSSAGYRFLLKTDISRFFPTIYTHTIPWALHDKKVAKKNQFNFSKEFFGNLLDRHLRQGQEKQTIGIPIGPDTSHVVAEIIAVAVDILLKESLGKWPNGFRYVDDYYLFFETYSDAEAALAALSKALQEFELQINFDKTQIISIHNISEDYWTHQIRNFEFALGGLSQRANIHHYFDMILDIAKKNSDENVAKYALKRVSSEIIRKENWDVFESHVCRIILAFPNTLQTIASILCTYYRYKYPLGKDRLGRLLNSLIREHAPLNHHSEVVWALWICKELKIPLDKKTVDVVSEMHSAVCALVALDLEKSSLTKKAINKSYWKNFCNENALDEDLWLLSYEAGIRKWIISTDEHVKGHGYFKYLKEKEIHFYDSETRIPPLFHLKDDVLETLKLSDEIDLFDQENIDISEFLIFEESDSEYADETDDWDSVPL